MSPISIPGVVHRDLPMHGDTRGSFVEIARGERLPEPFVQINHSHSRKGVLRGLHWHLRQADLWYVVRGRAQVALVDLRGAGLPAVDVVELSAESPATLYIPPRIAHGFLALEDLDLVYAVTAYYDDSDEHGIAWNDPRLAIPWAEADPIVSDRDSSNPRWEWEETSSSS